MLYHPKEVLLKKGSWETIIALFYQEYEYKGSGGKEKLPPHRFSTVGIVR
jgi:hypothetical protein